MIPTSTYRIGRRRGRGDRVERQAHSGSPPRRRLEFNATPHFDDDPRERAREGTMDTGGTIGHETRPRRVAASSGGSVAASGDESSSATDNPIPPTPPPLRTAPAPLASTTTPPKVTSSGIAPPSAAAPINKDRQTFRRADVVIDVDTLLQRDWMSQDYLASREAARSRRHHADDSDEEEEDNTGTVERKAGAKLTLTAATYTPRQGRWTTPKEIPQLTDDVDDLDWWFHSMQIHLNKCRITNRQERIDCLHTHTDDAFHQRVWQRCDAEGVSRSLMYADEDRLPRFHRG